TTMRDLLRLKEAQRRDFDTALTAIKNGRKQSQGMRYIFPQIHGLGFSSMCAYDAIKDLKEAEDVLNDPDRGEQRRTNSEALVELDRDDPHRVFGSPDDVKLLSCMTLFEAVEGRGGVFTRVIEKYYKGRRDQKTVEILA